jgi:pimeloyl-ACP methyl ester carboxylesterase
MTSWHVDDIDVHYEVRGEGEPLLLHGFFGSSADWVHLLDLDALAKRYRLVLPDARGHGRTTNPAARSRTGAAPRMRWACSITWA